MKIPSPNLFCSLQGSPCGPTMQGSAPCTAVPFFSKRKEPKIRQRGGILFGFSSEGQDRTSASCVIMLFRVRSREWALPILRTFLQKSYFPRELCFAKFSPPICSGSRRMSNTGVPLRTVECLCRAHFLPMQRGFKRGAAPFVKLFKLPKSNQEVFGASFVDFFATRNRPRAWAA